MTSIINNPNFDDVIVVYCDKDSGNIHFATEVKNLALVTGMLHSMQKLIDDMMLFPEDYQNDNTEEYKGDNPPPTEG